MDDVPLPEPQDPPRANGGRLARWQPLLTLVIAITAITLAVWEGLKNRRHNRLAVRPSIGAEIERGSDGENDFVRLGIESNGLGPAVITAYRIYFDGVVQDTGSELGTGRWSAIMEALELDNDSTVQMNAQAFGVGYYLPADREAIVFEVTRPMLAEGDTSRPPLADVLDRLAIQICYCSMYGTDCGDIAMTTGETEIQRCPAD